MRFKGAGNQASKFVWRGEKGSLLKLSALIVSERIASRPSKIRFGKKGREEVRPPSQRTMSVPYKQMHKPSIDERRKILGQ